MSIDDIIESAGRCLYDERLSGRELACVEHMYLRILSTAREYDIPIEGYQRFFKAYIQDKNRAQMKKRRTEETYD